MSARTDSGVFTMPDSATASPMSMSMTGSLSSPLDEPDFVDLPSKYLCIVCAKVLRNAMQQPCGHQLCEVPCVDILFDGKDMVTCPVRDEDCFEPFTKKEASI